MGNDYFIINFQVRKLVPEHEIGNEMDAYLGVSVVRLRLKFFNVKLETTTKINEVENFSINVLTIAWVLLCIHVAFIHLSINIQS